MVVPRGTRGRGYVLHITDVQNLPSIWASGALIADSRLGSTSVSSELGNKSIKQQRRALPVPCSAGGRVGDYVPMYFSARSPMLYMAHIGSELSPFDGDQEDLVHLVSHVDVIEGLGYAFAVTDRNAALAYAAYSDDLADLDQMIDWTLQNQQYWSDTDAEPDRKERRMAEFLVHDRLAVEAILGIGVANELAATRVRDILLGYSIPSVVVKPSWYY